MDIEVESGAQLLSAVPPPIRRHQGQSHSLGTVNTPSQVDVGQGGGTQVRCQQQVPCIIGVLLCPRFDSCANTSVAGIVYTC